MATKNEYLKPNDPIRQSVYPDEIIRADGTVRNPEYQKDSGLAWIWAGVAIAALAIVVFTFFGNDTRHEIPPSAVTSVTQTAGPPATDIAPTAATTSNATPNNAAAPAAPSADQPNAANDSSTPASNVRPVPVSPEPPPSNR